MPLNKWQTVILSRYLGEFQPDSVEADGVPVSKTSEDIKSDLEEMGNFSIEEISEEMVRRGYSIEIASDGIPRWKIKRVIEKLLE